LERKLIYVKKRILLLIMITVALSFMGHSPPVQATISEPNLEGLRIGDRVYMQMSPVSPWDLNSNYDYKGIWDVSTNNSPQGKSLYLMQPTGKNYGINLFHPSTVDNWVTAFNGSQDFVNSNLSSIHNWMYYQGTGYIRIYLRDLAELCGMHYYDSIYWGMGNVNTAPTNYPSAAITVPANINPGGKINWTITGQSFVKSKYPYNENKIKYTLTINGTAVANDTLAAKTFYKTGTYIVPQTAAVGSKISFILSVQDGVGRTFTKGKQVEVIQGKVSPAPPAPPVPETPPDPPAPPDYEPEADFDISNPSPIEGEQIELKDCSTHPGSKYGEQIVSYQWTIQNLTGATTKDTTAKWDTVGTYSITLRVEDQDGDSDKCTKKVVVGPALPAAVITLSTDTIIMGREIHIDGDQSSAAMGRSIKWDEMEWQFYGPDGALKYTSSDRYPLGKNSASEQSLTNSVLNQVGIWKVRLRVKDSVDNLSAWEERVFTVYPDQPPIADFWLVSEALRNSYQGYTLTVHDQSQPATPDGSLGDEIYQRTWALFYDGNNDGDFTDSGIDQTIIAGDTGKAASLSQVSANDPNPVIKFAKTGRFKLELTVRERADIWGTITPGLSANTSGKTLTDKQVMVINLAPTVDFSVKKKVPVDVQFAADCAVSDTKYNNLQSAQAAFVGDLEAGSIDAAIGVQRVQTGEVGEQFTSLITPANYNMYTIGEKLADTSWVYNQKRKSLSYAPLYEFLNVDNGETIESSFSTRYNLVKTADGTYIRGISTWSYAGWTMSSFDRIDANMDVVIPWVTYQNIVNASIPVSSDGWTYTIAANSYYIQNDGVIYFIKGTRSRLVGGVTVLDHKYIICKISPNATLEWSREIYNVTLNPSQDVYSTVVFRFPSSEKYIVQITSNLTMSFYLISPSECTLIKHYNYTNQDPGLYGKCGGTSNGQFFIVLLISDNVIA
jgi:hypothetical protein